MAAVGFCQVYVLKVQSFAQASQGWYDGAPLTVAQSTDLMRQT